jgi:hexokinase
LAGGRYYNKDNVAAITLGMSTNAAYVEPAQESELAESPNSNELVSDYHNIHFNFLFYKQKNIYLLKMSS